MERELTCNATCRSLKRRYLIKQSCIYSNNYGIDGQNDKKTKNNASINININ